MTALLSGICHDESGALTPGDFDGEAVHRSGARVPVQWNVRVITAGGAVAYSLWVRYEAPPLAMPQSSEAPADEGDPAEGLHGGYTLTSEIGDGTFGSVVLADAAPGAPGAPGPVAIKLIERDRVLSECWEPCDGGAAAILGLEPAAAAALERVPREALLLMRLEHPNVVRGLHFGHANAHVFHLVMEFPPDSADLYTFVEENDATTEPVASHLFRQLVSALAYLHGLGIVHRDVKDENVVIDSRLNAKLVDFGSAANFREGVLFDTFCGTLEYCAPEVLLGNPYPGPELDVFAAGVTLFSLLFGVTPFCDVEETIAGDWAVPFPVSDACSALLAIMLQPDPEQRITAAGLQDHLWLNMSVEREVEAMVGGGWPDLGASPRL